MTVEQFEQLYSMIYCVGLIAAFGLGAIKGGQR